MIENVIIRGRLTIRHDDVLVRDVVVMGTVHYMIRIEEGEDGECPTGVVIEHTEVDGSAAPARALAVYGGPCGYTFRSGYIHDVGRGIAMVNDVTVANSYIYASRTWSGSHRNAVLTNGGRDLRIVGNSLFCEGQGCSSALSLYGDFAPVHDVLVYRNLFATTGRFCVYGGSEDHEDFPEASDVRILFNHFSTTLAPKCGTSGPLAAFDDGVRGNVFIGNVWHETSATVIP